MSKPIRIEKDSKRIYRIYVNGVIFTSAKTGEVVTYRTKGDAVSMAHTIGRYKLNLGSFVDTYVEHVNLARVSQ